MSPYIHTYYVNIRDGASILRERQPLASGDKNADEFVIHLQDCGKDVDLGNASVTGKVLRPDGQTVPLTGTIDKGAAHIVLDENCYAVPGEIRLTVTLSAGNVIQSVLIVMMDVQTCATNIVVDNGVIGTLSELLAEIGNMREATAAANEAAETVEEFKTEISQEVSQLSSEISDLESKTGLKYTNGEKLTPLYNYMESFVADNVIPNADGKVYRVDGTLATSSGSTSYRATVNAGDVYLISGRLSSYYIVLFSGDVVHRAYSITDVGAEITESGHGTYAAATKSFKNWRLVIPDGVDAIGVSVATYSDHNGTLYKEEAVVEYINVTDVKAKADAATAAANEAAETVEEFKTEISQEVSQLSSEMETLETETGLKYVNGEKQTLLYDYKNSIAADTITQNADGKIYKADGTMASSSGSTSYKMLVNAGDVYIITGRLSNFYIVLFAGGAVYRAYSIEDVGADITESGNGTYNSATKSFANWRLVIPDGVDSIGVTVATYSSYNSTLYKKEIAIEYINVTEVKEKAETAYEHTVMPVSTMPVYLQNVLGYKPLGALSKPYICLSTDDGREGLIHQTIEMVVDAAHVPVTFCIHSKADIFYAQKRKKYTIAQVAEKINGAIVNDGCELALHDNKIWADMSESKKTPYTEATLHQFVQDEKAFIANPREIDTSTELGVSWEYESASAPEHATDALVSVIMGGEFGVLRSGDTSMGLIKNIYDYKCLGARSNLYCLTSKNFNSGMYNTLEKAKAAVDYAIENNLVLSIFWHEAIMASATEESNENEHITDEQITNILLPMIEYAKAKGVEFVTLSQIPYLQ